MKTRSLKRFLGGQITLILYVIQVARGESASPNTRRAELWIPTVFAERNACKDQSSTLPFSFGGPNRSCARLLALETNSVTLMVNIIATFMLVFHKVNHFGIDWTTGDQGLRW
jgi:hypothetical protein